MVGELDEVREDLAEPDVEPVVVGVRDSRLEADAVRVTVPVLVLELVPVEERLLMTVRVDVVDAVDVLDTVEDFVEDDDVVDVLDATAEREEEALSLDVLDATADRVPVRVDVDDAVGKAPATAS